MDANQPKRPQSRRADETKIWDWDNSPGVAPASETARDLMDEEGYASPRDFDRKANWDDCLLESKQDLGFSHEFQRGQAMAKHCPK